MSAATPDIASTADKIVIAHRGASGYLPEHTLAAKAMAHAQGAHFIEQDVVLTKDGVPVVLHDIHLDTVTDVAERFPGRARGDGRYYAIDFTLGEIRRLRVHERIDPGTGMPVFPHRFPRGKSRFHVPTLAEEIELIQGLNASTKSGAGIYPEIKKPAFHRGEGQDISRIVLDVLGTYGYGSAEDAVYLQCFDWTETRRIRRELGYEGRLIQLIGLNEWNEAPDVNYDELISDRGLDAIAGVADGIGPILEQLVDGIDGEGDIVSTGRAEAARARGLLVHPYTFRRDDLPGYAGTLEDLLEIYFRKIGVDGVFTDFPDIAVGFLEDLGRARQY